MKDLTQATKDWAETQELPQELPALHKKDLVQDSLGWEKAKDEVEKRDGIKPYAERILTLKLSMLLPEFGMRVREKVLMERIVSHVTLPSARRKILERSGVTLSGSWSRGGIPMTFSI